MLDTFAMSGVTKMALSAQETKNRDHFYRPNNPSDDIVNAFWPLKSGIVAILHSWHI